MFGSRIYIPRQHDFFNELTTLFVNLASFNAATESFWNSSSTRIPHGRDDTLNLYGKVAHVSFPIHDMMHMVVRNHWPAELKLAFHPGTLSSPPQPDSVQLQSNAIADMVTQLVGTTFLNTTNAMLIEQSKSSVLPRRIGLKHGGLRGYCVMPLLMGIGGPSMTRIFLKQYGTVSESLPPTLGNLGITLGYSSVAGT